MEAALAEMRGDVAKAEDKYRQAIAVLQHAKNIGYAASLLYLHGRLAFRNDDTSQAREDYKQSLEWAHDIHAANLIARNLCSLATLEAETGNSETAKPFARDALARCRRLSLVGEQTEMEHLLARLGVG